jgi:asparagine synthase (glutamine-hydrolysing)
MLFLGIYDSSSPTFRASEIEELKSAISREPEDQRQVILRPHFALVSLDFGLPGAAFFIRAQSDSMGPVGMVLGRPYLNSDSADSDADQLIAALKARDMAGLSSTRGSYCAAYYDPESMSLKLCSDKVGVFPVYIAKIGTRIYFSNALRMLNSIPAIPKKLVPERLFSQIAFGYCLARDTVFSDIDRMYGGEIFEIKKTEVTISRYWNWGDILPSRHSEQDLQQEVYDAFIDAVRIRADSGPGEISFLSGGLDSRCIVAALRNIGRPVWSLNFAPEGSQDYFFGRLAADALGSHHYELGIGMEDFSSRQKTILDSWANINQDLVAQGVKPYRVWSGDGGSVGMGHVYLDEIFIEKLRAKDIRGASEYLMEFGKIGVPVRAFQSEIKQRARLIPLEKMCEEIQGFSTQDPAKAGLLFFLMNDQRHHLATYFENLDLYKFEVVLPFFDSRLLELIVAAPIDEFLRHVFYNKWLSKFGQAITAVPWQAYPGHVACPLPIEGYGKLRNQWSEDWFEETQRQRQRLDDIQAWHAMLNNQAFPAKILSKNALWLAYWLTRLKIRDYGYILNAAKKVSTLSGAMDK